MKKYVNKILNVLSTRLGFILVLIGLYWLKTIWAYYIDFNLETENFYQVFLTIINPVPMAVLLISLAFYFRRTRVFYVVAWFFYVLLNLLLISNAMYYREFSDFITITAMLSSSSVSAGLGDSALNLLRPWDIVYIVDFIVLISLFIMKKIKTDPRAIKKRASVSVTTLSIMLFSINLFLAEVDRPELLSRGFSNTYVVRALGLPAFLAYDGNQTYKTHKVRSEAKPEELDEVIEYVNAHYAAPNDKYFGIGKGKNVFMIHLESFQQFLIDYQLEVDDESYEVTPFINSLYHSNETFSFSNFFHQVKAGKTSDSETLMETSLFGLNQGSYFVQYGGQNTQEAAPYILSELEGYSTAVFHGNNASFWNRNNTYKKLGYQYFFDQSYMSDPNSENSFQYGLNDKIMFQDSIQYLEHMQQPFYTKFITVSNHYPYQNLSGDEEGFPLAETKDETINGYFSTANYLDSALKSFFDYLKETGLYENSIFVLYGDHYGISNARNSRLAELVGKDSETWSQYDNAMMQRVPYMIHIPGMTEGSISDTYGGEVDNLPTLLHILGIDTSNYIQLGQDLLSEDNSQVVALRTSGYFITPQYTSYGSRLYDTETGVEITQPEEETQSIIQEIRDAVKLQLSISDSVQTGDLLRFYTKSGLKGLDSSTISYNNSLEKLIEIEKELGSNSTSLFSTNNNKSTIDLYNAPSYLELHKDDDKEESSNSSSSTDGSTEESEESETSTEVSSSK